MRGTEPDWCDSLPLAHRWARHPDVVASVTATVLEVLEPMPTCYSGAELGSDDCLTVAEHEGCDLAAVTVDGVPKRGSVSEIIGTDVVWVRLCDVPSGAHEVQVCFHPDAPAVVCGVEQPATGGAMVGVSRAPYYQVRIHVEEVQRGPSALEDAELTVELPYDCRDCPVFDAGLPSGPIHLHWWGEEAGLPRADLCVMPPPAPPAATGCQRCSGGDTSDPWVLMVVVGGLLVTRRRV